MAQRKCVKFGKAYSLRVQDSGEEKAVAVVVYYH